VTTLPGSTSYDIAESTLAVARCCCRGDLAMARCHYRVMLVMSMSSHAGAVLPR
jgi:hypothetical protein